MESAMRSGVVIVEEVEREARVAVSAGAVAAGVGPLASEGLDEAFGFAVGLWPVRSGEAVFDPEVAARISEGVGAIRHAVIGQHRANLDPVEGVEADHLLERANHGGDFFVRMNAGEPKAGVIIDRDVQRFDPGAFVAIGAVAGTTDARLEEPTELLHVEVDQFSRLIAFVADDRRGSRVERFEQV